MEWHKRQTLYSTNHPAALARRDHIGGSEEEFLAKIAANAPFLWRDTIENLVAWVQDGKPYYKMWPAIAEGLRRVRLDLPCEAISPLLEKMPRSISVRLPVGHEIETKGFGIREFLVSKQYVFSGGKTYHGLTVQTDVGETGRIGEGVYNVLTFPLKRATLEEAIKHANGQMDPITGNLTEAEVETCVDSVRVYLGLAMIHDNPDMVEAVVLRKDQAKYAATRDPKYVEKAKRRGEYGFNVGANIEVLPHFRRPHFAIRWTGKGHEVPKLVPVKGCVVKRSKFTEVPTGYQADEEAEAATV